MIKSRFRGREVGLVETKSMARRVEVRMDGFHLSDGHRDCCPFHCVVSRLHFEARKSAESDGIILNSKFDGAAGLREKRAHRNRPYSKPLEFLKFF